MSDLHFSQTCPGPCLYVPTPSLGASAKRRILAMSATSSDSFKAPPGPQLPRSGARSGCRRSVRHPGRRGSRFMPRRSLVRLCFFLHRRSKGHSNIWAYYVEHLSNSTVLGLPGIRKASASSADISFQPWDRPNGQWRSRCSKHVQTTEKLKKQQNTVFFLNTKGAVFFTENGLRETSVGTAPEWNGATGLASSGQSIARSAWLISRTGDF